MSSSISPSRMLINVLGYQHSEPVKIVSGCVPVDTNQLCWQYGL
ncbi:hypothetical protein ACZ87_02523 [Candidatus Erwinia dacicola]|uniref:Uncharacterized protein n=1 Tax=Candidatus Erwinia dacicola TaxID=252393 RepID=A0A328TJL4_9GAMM|nr:hypothetical protein ACZ87_02523 [Candidatus Erwinia dacicola]